MAAVAPRIDLSPPTDSPVQRTQGRPATFIWSVVDFQTKPESSESADDVAAAAARFAMFGAVFVEGFVLSPRKPSVPKSCSRFSYRFEFSTADRTWGHENCQ